MPEIGETLRETRMRRRIDMTEVEAATKIRAKYLRALENEEWDLLPGPTFVKTFLRTYAEYLDLDPRLLVEEYRQRYERPTTQDLTPFGPGMGGQRRRRRRRRPIGPFVVVVLGVAALLGALYVLGSWGDQPEEEAPTNRADATPTAVATATPEKKKSRKKKATPPRVTLRLTATDAVFVCLVDATGREVIDGQILEGGTRTRRFRSQRFRANFGNGNIRMNVNGKTYNAAKLDEPVGYEFRPGKAPKRLSDRIRVGLCAT
ncbi:MAG TPA: helix-turn-helix domain-containing protein [Solirubrobacter sp.]|nr:helix-turn-helix domain-containing protein [Solirubrobacter sp.]